MRLCDQAEPVERFCRSLAGNRQPAFCCRCWHSAGVTYQLLPQKAAVYFLRDCDWRALNHKAAGSAKLCGASTTMLMMFQAGENGNDDAERAFGAQATLLTTPFTVRRVDTSANAGGAAMRMRQIRLSTNLPDLGASYEHRLCDKNWRWKEEIISITTASLLMLLWPKCPAIYFQASWLRALAD